MSEIEYRREHISRKKDGFAAVLNETAEYFGDQRVHIFGSAFDEILTEQTMFDAYVTHLCSGLTGDEADQMQIIMENARMHILGETSISGIQPIASLSMPTVRKVWPKVALKNAVPTEAVKAPKFVISYMEPYLINPDGTKVALPTALRDMTNTNAQKTALHEEAIALPMAGPLNLLTRNAKLKVDAAGVAQGASVALPGSHTVARGDSIDPIFFVEYVTLTRANMATQRVRLHKELDIRQNATIVVTDADGRQDTLFCNLDRQACTFSAASMLGYVASVEIRGSVSSETNYNTQSISFDVKTKDITIGTGAHLNAPLPLEWLTDNMALYQIDGALEVVDLMSNVVAQKLDQEILQFLQDSFDRNQNTFTAVPYAGSFDIRPSAGFAGAPKDWREELKTVIDWFAIKMKNDSAFSNGKFVIIGNPLDVNLITNVTWTFNSVTDERAGVEVEYSIGAYSGSQRYEIVSSLNVPQGVIRMIFVPGTPKQMTYKYYPYTFNVEKGYIDPNRALMPSIMMTKRHTIEELTPIQCEITISNNTGTMLDGLDRTWSTTLDVQPA